MTRKLTNEQIHEIHAHLCGTCGVSIDSELEPLGLTEDDLTIEDLREIDEAMMVCPNCGWWCDTDEFGDNEESGELWCDECLRDR